MAIKIKVALFLAVVVMISVLVPFSTLAGAAAPPQFEVVASGLDNPRGLAFGPEGALYVAEAGRGGPGACSSIALFGAPVCYGPTGAVTRVLNGHQTRIASGLGSFAHSDGSFAWGPMDIAFDRSGSAYVPNGTCWAPGSPTCAKLLRLSPNGEWRIVADLLAYEIKNNPVVSHGESDPYAVLALPGERIVVDAAGNVVLRVASDGTISTLAVFPQRFVEGPDRIEIAMDAVPTSVAVGPDGAFYVGELTGYPFPVGGARIYRFVPGKAPEVFADGFTNVIHIAFDTDGSLLVLELAKNGLLSGDPTGALIRLKRDGSRATLASDGLNMPTAVLVGRDGALYLSNCGTCAVGKGQVIRLETKG